MAVYQYRGRAANGRAVSGTLEAQSMKLVAKELAKRKITPIDIKASAGNIDWKSLAKMEIGGGGKVTTQDISFFSRQLYTLLKAGVPISQALMGLRESAANPAFAKIISQMIQGLEAGETITAVLKKHPKIFTELYVSMVHVGEQTGNLPAVMLELSQYLQQEKEVRDQIKTAMRYPMFVVIAVSLAIVVLNIFVIPAFSEMFAEMGAELPLPTRLMIATSDFMIGYWYLILMVLAGLFYAIRSWLNTEVGRMSWDKRKLKMPIVGPILYGSAIVRFARGFAITSKSGLPVVQGIPLISKALDNKFLERQFFHLKVAVERGEGIAVNAKRMKIFPPIVCQMLEVGEETGQLEELLGEIADYYAREVDFKLKGLSSAIEPILIGLIGGIVMIVLLGVFLPMWNMMDVLKGA